MITAGIIVAALAIFVVIMARDWPFTRDAVLNALQQQSASQVEIATFHRTYFPHPGCVAERLSFQRGQAKIPLITLRRLTIMSSYAGLLTNRISLIRAEGLRLTVAPQTVSSSSPGGTYPAINSGLKIGEIIADGAVVEVAPSGPGKQALVFTARKLALHSVADHSPLQFDAVVQLPEPPAILHIAGKFGPWAAGQGGQTPLSGSYQLQDANLGAFSGLSGVLSSSGTFNGVMQHLTLDGTTDVPDFALKRSGHAVHLATRFHALVNGMNGDVALDPVVAHSGKTTVVFIGDISGGATSPGKTATLQMSSDQATIQDLMWIFIRDKQPPMLGNIKFSAKATLPPGDRPFLDKLRLNGDFGIAGGKYTNPETQKEIDVMSARARGKADEVEDENDRRGDNSYDPGRVISDLKGQVAVRDGIARFSNTSFDVPGAAAEGGGTYNLHSERVNMHGTVQMEAKLSQATTGVKSFLLKLVQPFVHKKKQQGSTVLVKLAGTYHKPTFTVLPIPAK